MQMADGIRDAAQKAVPTGNVPYVDLTIPALNVIDWKPLLAGRPGWSWDSTRGGLICPADNNIRACWLQPARTGGDFVLLFRGLKTRCRGCTMRSMCSSSTATVFRKQFTVKLSAQQAEMICRARTAEFPSEWLPNSAFPSPRNDEDLGPGPYAMTTPLLLPAELRKRFKSAVTSCRISIVVVKPPQLRPIPPYIAMTPAIRQSRRKTWAERRAWNALPQDAVVTTTLSCGPMAARLLQDIITREDSAVAQYQ